MGGSPTQTAALALCPLLSSPGTGRKRTANGTIPVMREKSRLRLTMLTEQPLQGTSPHPPRRVRRRPLQRLFRQHRQTQPALFPHDRDRSVCRSLSARSRARQERTQRQCRRLRWTSAHSARLSLLYNGFLSCGRRCVFFGPDPALFGRDRAPPATIPLHFPPRPSSSGRCGILVFLLSRFSRACCTGALTPGSLPSNLSRRSKKQIESARIAPAHSQQFAPHQLLP